MDSLEQKKQLNKEKCKKYRMRKKLLKLKTNDIMDSLEQKIQLNKEKCKKYRLGGKIIKMK